MASCSVQRPHHPGFTREQTDQGDRGGGSAQAWALPLAQALSRVDGASDSSHQAPGLWTHGLGRRGLRCPVCQFNWSDTAPAQAGVHAGCGRLRLSTHSVFGMCSRDENA